MRFQLQLSSNLSASHTDLKDGSTNSGNCSEKTSPTLQKFLKSKSQYNNATHRTPSPVFIRHQPRGKELALRTPSSFRVSNLLLSPEGYIKTKRQRSKSSYVLLNSSVRSPCQVPAITAKRAPRIGRLESSLNGENKVVPSGTSGKSGPNYRVLRAIQKGITSTVFQAVEVSTNRTVAIKRLVKSPHNLRLVQTEARIAHALKSHRNIVKLHEVVETPSHYLLVQEFLSGGDLFEYIVNVDGKDLSEKACMRLFRQVVSAIEYMHEKGWCHRDVKLENVVLGEGGVAKLCDFGFSCAAQDTSATTPGTVEYTCPELLAGIPNVDLRKADVWSAGILLFALLTRHMDYEFPWPRAADSCPEFFRYRSGLVDTAPWNIFSPPIRVLLSYVLAVDPSQRCSMNECLMFIRDHWPHLDDDDVHDSHEHTHEVEMPPSLRSLKDNLSNTSISSAVTFEESDLNNQWY